MSLGMQQSLLFRWKLFAVLFNAKFSYQTVVRAGNLNLLNPIFFAELKNP